MEPHHAVVDGRNATSLAGCCPWLSCVATLLRDPGPEHVDDGDPAAGNQQSDRDDRPSRRRAAPGPVSLHGLSDDDTIWLRRTSIERYVAPLWLVVVMPQVHRSFYADEAYGGRYWRFLTEEVCPTWSHRSSACRPGPRTPSSSG